MKTALCLSGHMRTFKQTYSSLKKYLLDILNPDIFISTWESVGFWGDFEHCIGFNNNGNVEEQEIKHLFNPKALLIERYENFDEIFKNRAKTFESNKIWYARPKNVISMYYKSYSSIQLKKQYENTNSFKYDLVIKTRPDIQYFENVPLLNFDGKSFNVLNTFTTNEGIGDIFLAGNSSEIDKFFELYKDFEILFNKGLRFCPHEYIKHYLDYLNIKYTIIKFQMDLVNTPKGYCQK